MVNKIIRMIIHIKHLLPRQKHISDTKPNLHKMRERDMNKVLINQIKKGMDQGLRFLERLSNKTSLYLMLTGSKNLSKL